MGSGTAANNTGNFNTAVGYQTLYNNTTGNFNTANGMLALSSNTTGNHNTAIGDSAMLTNTTGNYSTATGAWALLNNNMDGNTADGSWALLNNTSGFGNTGIGDQSLYGNTTGSDNTAIGYWAGNGITTGSDNTALGYNAQVPVATASNQVRVGDASVTYAGVQVAWTITSDRRWKSDISESNLGLDFIKRLRPVSYYRNNDKSKKLEYGFIAQELEETLNTSGAGNNGIISKDDKGMYGVRYNDLMAPMVKAIQEQQKMIDELKKQNELILQQNTEMKKELELLKKK
jgi:hypothetical protein